MLGWEAKYDLSGYDIDGNREVFHKCRTSDVNGECVSNDDGIFGRDYQYVRTWTATPVWLFVMSKLSVAVLPIQLELEMRRRRTLVAQHP
jgi:hypothetical protein